MKTKIKATNIKLTEDIKSYLDKKLSTLNKLIDAKDESVICFVEIGKTTKHHQSGDVFMAEINMHVAGKDLRAVFESSDLNSAIDGVKDEMKNVLRSHKDKKIESIKKGGRKIKDMIRGINGVNK